MGFLSSVVGALGGSSGIASGLASFGGDILSGMLSNTAAKKAATTASQREMTMWNAQNAYNTPAAQMERLREAGLNPMLVYGQGAVSNASGSFSSAPKASSPSYNIGSPIQASYTARKMGQDIQLGQEQVGQIKESKRLLAAQVANQMVENGIKQYNLEYANKHGLPYGAAPNVASSTLGAFGGVGGLGDSIKDAISSISYSKMKSNQRRGFNTFRDKFVKGRPLDIFF